MFIFQKVKYLQILNESKLDELVKNTLELYKSKKGLIKFDEIDIVAREISKKLSEEGFPFAKVSFDNRDLKLLVVKSKLIIDYG